MKEDVNDIFHKSRGLFGIIERLESGSRNAAQGGLNPGFTFEQQRMQLYEELISALQKFEGKAALALSNVKRAKGIEEELYAEAKKLAKAA